MREDLKKTLWDLEERAIEDLEALTRKEDITPMEWKIAGKVVDIVKDVETIMAMCCKEEDSTTKTMAASETTAQ